MRQVKSIFTSVALSAANVEYGPLLSGMHTVSTTQGTWDEPAPCDLEFTYLFFELPATPGSGKSRTLTVMIDGVASAIEVTISDLNTTGFWAGGPVSVLEGQRLELRSTPTNSPGTSGPKIVTMGFSTPTPYTNAQGNVRNVSTTPIAYGFLAGYRNNDVAGAGQLVPVDTHVSKIKMRVNPGTSGAQFTAHIYVDGVQSVASAITVADAGAAGAQGSVDVDINIPAGSRVAVLTSKNSGNARNVAWQCECETTVAGASILGTGVTYSTFGLRFITLAYGELLQWPVATTIVATGPCRSSNVALKIRNLMSSVDAAPGNTFTRTWTAYVDGVASSLVASIANTDVEGDSADLEVDLTSGQTLAIGHVTTSGANLAASRTSLLLVDPQAVPPEDSAEVTHYRNRDRFGCSAA